ncbi:MAG: arylsulfatase [Planctomycetaceae bacterium]
MRTATRPTLLTPAILFCGAMWACCLTSMAAERPNVVFILADDLGYGDVACFGGDRCRIATPHFDRLAAQGLRFTDAHANASVCVPTRMAIMTGRYPWRFAKPEPGGPWGFLGLRLPPTQHTLGSLMQTAGYRTGYVGKWHLGTRMQTTDGKTQGLTNVNYGKPLEVGPQQFAFNHSFILPGSLDMFPYAFVQNNAWVGRVTAQKGWSAFNRVGPAAEDFLDTKVLDTFSAQAEQFLARSAAEAKAGQPFFLYLALTAPHTPTSPSPQFAGRSEIGIYGDFVMETDHCIGRVLTALKSHGLDDNTLVIATSDHGPAPYAGRQRKATAGQLKQLEQAGHYSAGIYRGYKFSVYEGGLRVPFVVRWPGTVRAGSTCEQLVGLQDLMATLSEITQVSLQATQGPDSISMLPLLQDPQSQPTRTSMVLEGTRGKVIRSGVWKLALCPGSGSRGVWGNAPADVDAWRQAVQNFGRNPSSHAELAQAPFVQLFHLERDPGETTNLAGEHPEQVRQLLALLQTQIDNGRSTPGTKLRNDRPRIKPFSSVPPFVWNKK